MATVLERPTLAIHRLRRRMLRAAVLPFVICASPTPVFSQTLELEALQRPWFDCLNDKARAYATTSEAAATVADAALTACSGWEGPVRAAMNAYVARDLLKRGVASTSDEAERLARGAQQAGYDLFIRRARATLVALVIDERARALAKK